MFPFPTLSEKIVRSRATETSWRRGVHYFESGAVQEIVWRDGVLTAQVEGYKVRVRFNEQGEIEEASCSCPYEGGGDCKHIVAALLALIRQPEKVSVRPSLRTLLEGQSREQLIALLLFLADHYRSATHSHLFHPLGTKQMTGCFLLQRGALGQGPATSPLHRRYFPGNSR
jgi:uncharacterized Zn finger protein